jgi:hypothetical protein
MLCFPPLVFFSHCHVHREIIAAVHRVFSLILQICHRIRLSISPSSNQPRSLRCPPSDHFTISHKLQLPVAMEHLLLVLVSLQHSVSKLAPHRSQLLFPPQRTLVYAHTSIDSTLKLTLCSPAYRSLKSTLHNLKLLSLSVKHF